jgi:hypothetical protein
MNADLVTIVCCCRCGLVSGRGTTSHIPRPTHMYKVTKSASVCLPSKDGQVMPKTGRDTESQ